MSQISVLVLTLQVLSLGVADPVAVRKDLWSSQVTKLCESVPSGDIEFFPWRADVQTCSDEASLALCYLARRLSAIGDCAEAAEAFQMCYSFPDAMTNYCCAAASGLPGCASDDRNSPTNADGIAQLTSNDDSSTARPFLPHRQLFEMPWDAPRLEKSVIVMFPEDASICNFLYSLRKILQLATLFFNIDTIINILTSENVQYLESNITPIVENYINRNGSDAINAMLNETVLLPPNPQTVTLNSVSPVEMGPFQWQSGSSQPQKVDEVKELREEGSHKCATLPNFAGKVVTSFMTWASGLTDMSQFAQSLKVIGDSHFVLVDGSKADLTRHSLQDSAIPSISTPMFIIIPACTRGTTFITPSMEVNAFDVMPLLPQLQSASQLISQKLSACEASPCFENFWARIIQSISGGEDFFHNKAAPTQLKEALLSFLHHFDDIIQNGIQDYLASLAPVPIGFVLQALIGATSMALSGSGFSFATAIKTCLLLLQAWQKEDTGVDAIVGEFLASTFACSAAGQAPESTERPMTRELQWKKRHQWEPVIEKPPKIFQEMGFENETVPPIAGLGNLISREGTSQGNDTPISGYQCRDSLSSLFDDYFSIWLERGTCFDLIKTFGCFAQRARWRNMLPFSILLHACPASWVRLCQAKMSPVHIASQLRMMAGEDIDPVTDEKALQEAFWARVLIPFEKFDPAEENLQIESLLSQVQQSPAFEPFQLCIGSQLRNIDEHDSNTTSPVASSKFGQKSPALPHITQPFWFYILAVYVL